MQPPFSCTPKTLQALEKALATPRLGRYLSEADGDKNYALRLYVWNIRLCEAFYFPTQTAEICVRNAVQRALTTKFGPNWFDQRAFINTLSRKNLDQLDNAKRTKRFAYGNLMTADHIVSALMAGFWLNLLTSKYERVLWPNQFPSAFPNKPTTVSRQNVFDKFDRLREFRNRIAHHQPIFDRAPTDEYLSIMELIGWICTDTRWFVETTARVVQTISSKPQPL